MIIRLKQLQAHTYLGIFDREQKAPRPIFISLHLRFDGATAARTDRIEDTIDYDRLVTRILTHVESTRYGLIERVVSDILDILAEEPRILEAEVEVDKPGAVPTAASVSVSNKRLYPRP